MVLIEVLVRSHCSVEWYIKQEYLFLNNTYATQYTAPASTHCACELKHTRSPCPVSIVRGRESFASSQPGVCGAMCSPISGYQAWHEIEGAGLSSLLSMDPL